MCNYNGLEDSPAMWEENEFRLLLGSKKAPGFLLMTSFIGDTAVADKNVLQSSFCKVSEYITRLLQFYDQHKVIIQEKHKNIADLLDLIQSNIEEK